MRWCCAFLVLACGEAAVLRAASRAASLESSLEASLELSGDWAAYAEAESEDRHFLLAQLDKTEDDLLRLQQWASPVPAAPVKANATEAKKAAPQAKKEAPKAEKDLALPAGIEKDPAKMIAKLGLKGKAALAPMLAMLKSLYQDSKDRIAQQNAREEKSKKWFAEKEAEHKKKIDSIEAKFKAGKLSEEFHTNETRDETRYFTYWSRCRERQHRQFHTNLKIQHAMMMKTKKMVDMYEKVMSGDASKENQAKKQLSQMTGMPEIVFLQDAQKTITSFCHESLEEVRKERQELQEMEHDGPTY